jgi:hypothetical protein
VHMAPWAGKGAERQHSSGGAVQTQHSQHSQQHQDQQQVVVSSSRRGRDAGVGDSKQQQPVVSQADVKAVGELALTKLQQDLRQRQQQQHAGQQDGVQASRVVS